MRRTKFILICYQGLKNANWVKKWHLRSAQAKSRDRNFHQSLIALIIVGKLNIAGVRYDCH